MRDKQKPETIKKPAIFSPLHKFKIIAVVTALIIISILVAAYDTYNMSVLADAIM